MKNTPAIPANPSRRTVLKYALTGLLTGSALSVLPSPFSAQAAAKAQRALIVYFSHTGNTRAVAQHIHALAGGEMLELQTVHPYPEAYKATTEQAKKELAEGYKPPLSTTLPDVQNFELLFVGSPNWWGTIAPPMMTFLSECDVAGKTIAPFITHEGSALGRSVQDIKALCPRATLVDGLAIRGRNAANAQKDVAAWLRRLGVLL